jgi:hypothetical protein
MTVGIRKKPRKVSVPDLELGFKAFNFLQNQQYGQLNNV